MRYTLLVVAIATALFAGSVPASAQQPANVGVGTVPPGVITTNNTPKVASYDGQWVVDGFLLTDKNGEPQLHWDSEMQVAHNGMAVCWSPDSQRVVMVDHSGKAVIFYCAERENNQWYEAKVTNADPQRPEGARFEQVELLDWISRTELRIKERYLVDSPEIEATIHADPTANPTPELQEQITTLRFDGTNVQYPEN